MRCHRGIAGMGHQPVQSLTRSFRSSTRYWKRISRGSRSSGTPRGGYMSVCAMNMASPAGSPIVTDYVRERRRRTREVFVPLVHAPGHAQVDFGEALGEIGGVVRKLHYFAMALPHSDAFFIKALSGGDNRGLLRWPCSWLCLLRRRAAVRALRQHHDRGGADPRGRNPATHQNFLGVAVALPVRRQVRPSWQGQRVSYWNAIGPRDNGER